MTKLILKTTLLTLVACFTTLMANAQLGYDFSQYEIGTAVGFDQVSGNADPAKMTQAIHFNFTYNFTPFTNFVAEVQLGKLQGGALTTPTGRQFNNDFSAYIFRGQLQLGEVLDYSNSQFKNVLKNLYFSTGAGYIVNHITQINRYSLITPGEYTPGQNSSNNPFIPLRIGYDFKVYNKYQQPALKFDVGYQYNMTFADGLDGFSASNRHESFSQFTIGVKFAFGGAIISYRKQITY